MLLEGRLALVTGAGQGNGAAIAKGLAIEGARVIVTDIVLPAAENTAAEIRGAGGQAWAYLLDVADTEACRVLARTIGEAAGEVSLVINNAGICPRHDIDSPDLDRLWTAAMDVNLKGTLNVSVAFLPALRATRGAIVNIASIAAFVSTATSISYPTSKAGVRMLTQSMAHELAKDGVRVNAIAPGTFATPMTEATRFNPERSERFLTRIPMGRYGEPEELVGPVVFLGSSMSSYVTGTTVVVDGGYWRCEDIGMIVRMGLLTRRPDLLTAEFRQHWRTIHGPLASRLPGLRAYHQNHIVDSAQLGISYARGNWNIDGFSELWFDDRVSMSEAIASDLYAPIAADSDAFVSDTRVIVAEQQVVVPVPPDAGPLIKRMSILTRTPDCSSDRFRHEWWVVHAPMVERFPELVGYTQNLIVDREAAPGASSARDSVPADGIVEMWFRDEDGLQAAFASDAARLAQAHAREFIGEITTFLVETHRVV